MHCPSCKSDGAYVGLMTVECASENCAHFSIKAPGYKPKVYSVPKNRDPFFAGGTFKRSPESSYGFTPKPFLTIQDEIREAVKESYGSIEYDGSDVYPIVQLKDIATPRRFKWIVEIDGIKMRDGFVFKIQTPSIEYLINRLVPKVEKDGI